LNKEEETERIKLAKEILEWTLDQDRDFSEIMPEIQIKGKQVNTKFFDANQEVEKWVMPYPKNPEVLMVRNTRPERGSFWWEKISPEELEQRNWQFENEIEGGWFGEAPSTEEVLESIMLNKDKPTKSWEEAYAFYSKWKDWFRNYNDAEKFLEYDFEIDYDNCFIMSTEDRKEYCDDLDIRPQQLKKALEEEGLFFVYARKLNKDLHWFLRRKE
jgi:hypothetical protein